MFLVLELFPDTVPGQSRKNGKPLYEMARRIFKEVIMKTVLLCFFILLFQNAYADSPFVCIMFDSKTESELSLSLPTRDLAASIVTKLASYNAKAIVYKFFIDQPKDSTIDNALAKAFKDIPIFLQASIDHTESTPNQIPDRFSLNDTFSTFNLLSGRSGWIPLPIFSANVAGIGFVSYRVINQIPLMVRYQNKIFPSLWFSVLKFALPNCIITDNKLTNGDKSLPINVNGELFVEYPSPTSFQYYSMVDVLKDRISKSLFFDKIVIIGYDCENIESLMTNSGNMTIHRAFYFSLEYLYNRLK